MHRRPPLRAALTACAAATLALLPASPLRADTPLAAAEKLLASKDWQERIKGLEALEACPKSAQAEKAAIGVLDDEDWGVEIRACQALAKIGGDPAEDALARLVVDGEIQWVRDAAVEAVKSLDPAGGGGRLLDRARAVGPKNETARARALLGAGRAGGKDLLKRLVAFAASKDEAVVAAALRAMGDVGREEALAKDVLDRIGAHLDARDDRKLFHVHAACIEALGKVTGPAAAGMLVTECVLLPDDDLYAQERIARGLEGRAADDVTGALRTGLAQAKKPDEARRLVRLAGRVRCAAVREEIEALAGHKEERVRSEAVKALGLIHDAASAPALQRALDDKSPYVRIEAVIALARTLAPADFRKLAAAIRKDAVELVRLQLIVELADAGDPAGIAEIEPLLSDPGWRAASAAAAAIGTLGVASDLPKLKPFIAARSWQMKAAAFEGLGRLRAPEAVPLLTEGLLDKDPVVRGVCHANLQILCREKLGPDAKAWREWWAKNGAALDLVKRSRRTEEQRKKDAERNKDYGNQPATRAQGVEVLQKARIVVVTGAWDHVERVLGHLDIPFTLLRAQQLKESGLNPNQVILVNCEGNMDGDSRERVQWFVNVGGYLMTTDWALTHCVEPGFPGYLKQYSGSSTGNDVVVVEEAARGHPFLAGVFENVPAMKWWLEVQAFPITVVWPERTEVLVDSAEMRQRYGSSPMAATFRWGLGKVQHSLSHFYLQEEGMQQAQKPRDRMVFAADNLGLTLAEIREMAKAGRFEGQLNDEAMKQIAPDYSMFRLIVNVVKEKSDWVEGL